MNSKHIPMAKVKDYLLGTLPEDEAVSVEERYFTAPRLFEEIRLIERMLIEDYLDDSLEAGERSLFEDRYLRIPSLRKKIEDVRRRRAAQRGPRLLTFASIAATVLVVAALGIFIHTRVSQPGSGVPDSSVKSSRPSITLVLFPGQTKGPGGTGLQSQRLQLPKVDEAVTLIADLPGRKVATDYIARVSRINPDGSLTLIQNVQTRSVFRDERQQAVLVLPSSAFRAGDYLLDLSSLNGQPEETYVFRVLAAKQEADAPREQ